MNPVPHFAVEPWTLRMADLDLATLATSESLFALSNGHIGLRGSLEEGEPRAVPGTYVNGFYEERPLPHAEAGYGFPESGQTVVNVTDGKLIRLLVGDSPFDMRYGTVRSHERVLDLRAGVLSRRTEWTSPNGSTVRVTSRRLVSFTQRAVAAISWEVEPLDGDVYVAVQSDLLANDLAGGASRDPRAAAVLDRPLVAELSARRDLRAVLVHRTQRSQLRIAAGMDHVVEAPADVDTSVEAGGDLARLSVAARIPRGSSLKITKLIAYGWSSRRSAPALRDQVEGALGIARLTGFEGLVEQQRRFLDEFWARSDVRIEGDDELQQAIRVAMFHVLQAGARAEGQPIPAKGLTGPGYDGHTFWDTETFVLPMLTYTMPDAVRDALRWRHATLDMARQRAAELGQEGAAFPWRTIHGEECSGYWPAGTAAFHISADVADATARYIAASGDTTFEVDLGVEILVETARLWWSLGHYDGHGGFHLDGVTGPDEYTAVVDDNAYTNLMAQRNLREAVAACRRHPEKAAELGVGENDLGNWAHAAEAVVVHYDKRLGVHEQSRHFTTHAEWDFEGTPAEKYPLLLHHPYFELYRKQVIKQADLVLALHLRGDAFTPEEKARAFAYYDARTVRDSSLSAGTQAVVAAEVGQLDLAYDYWAEAAFTDLRDLHRNIGNGLHIASLAGAWLAAVSGFGGMRDHDGVVTFAPRLPRALSRISFRMTFLGRILLVDVRRQDPENEGVGPLEDARGERRSAPSAQQATYRLLAGEAISTWHHGEQLDLKPGVSVTRLVPELGEVSEVVQPAGREPERRSQRGRDQVVDHWVPGQDDWGTPGTGAHHP